MSRSLRFVQEVRHESQFKAYVDMTYKNMYQSYVTASKKDKIKKNQLKEDVKWLKNLRSGGLEITFSRKICENHFVRVYEDESYPVSKFLKSFWMYLNAKLYALHSNLFCDLSMLIRDLQNLKTVISSAFIRSWKTRLKSLHKHQFPLSLMNEKVYCDMQENCGKSIVDLLRKFRNLDAEKKLENLRRCVFLESLPLPKELQLLQVEIPYKKTITLFATIGDTLLIKEQIRIYNETFQMIFTELDEHHPGFKVHRTDLSLLLFYVILFTDVSYIASWLEYVVHFQNPRKKDLIVMLFYQVFQWGVENAYGIEDEKNVEKRIEEEKRILEEREENKKLKKAKETAQHQRFQSQWFKQPSGNPRSGWKRTVPKKSESFSGSSIGRTLSDFNFRKSNSPPTLTQSLVMPLKSEEKYRQIKAKVGNNARGGIQNRPHEMINTKKIIKMNVVEKVVDSRPKKETRVERMTKMMEAGNKKQGSSPVQQNNSKNEVVVSKFKVGEKNQGSGKIQQNKQKKESLVSRMTKTMEKKSTVRVVEKTVEKRPQKKESLVSRMTKTMEKKSAVRAVEKAVEKRPPKKESRVSKMTRNMEKKKPNDAPRPKKESRVSRMTRNIEKKPTRVKKSKIKKESLVSRMKRNMEEKARTQNAIGNMKKTSPKRKPTTFHPRGRERMTREMNERSGLRPSRSGEDLKNRAKREPDRTKVSFPLARPSKPRPPNRPKSFSLNRFVAPGDTSWIKGPKKKNIDMT